MPIDIAVQGWYEDTFAVIAVNGEINADSCAVLARTAARAAQTYQLLIIDCHLAGPRTAALTRPFICRSRPFAPQRRCRPPWTSSQRRDALGACSATPPTAPPTTASTPTNPVKNIGRLPAIHSTVATHGPMPTSPAATSPLLRMGAVDGQKWAIKEELWPVWSGSGGWVRGRLPVSGAQAGQAIISHCLENEVRPNAFDIIWLDCTARSFGLVIHAKCVGTWTSDQPRVCQAIPAQGDAAPNVVRVWSFAAGGQISGPLYSDCVAESAR